MRFQTARMWQHRNGIELPDRQSLMEAIKQVGFSSRSSVFAAELLSMAENTPDNQGFTYTHGDAATIGSEPTVDVRAMADPDGKTVYVLSIYNFDQKVRLEWLANEVILPKALEYDAVEVEMMLPPGSTEFCFDFGEVAKRLAAAGIDNVRGSWLAESIVATAEDNPSRAVRVVVEHGSLHVDIVIVQGSVRFPVDRSSGNFRWNIDADLVYGPLQMNENTGLFVTPKLRFEIAPPPAMRGTVTMRLPIVDPSVVDDVHKLSTAIAGVFS